MSTRNPTYYLRRYMEVAREVKRLVRRIDPNAKVYVFGSVVRGRFTASSDIDILVITERMELKYEIMVEVYRSMEAPVELHVVPPKGYSWYKRFAGDELIEVE